jgi:hypothetical protein
MKEKRMENFIYINYPLFPIKTASTTLFSISFVWSLVEFKIAENYFPSDRPKTTSVRSVAAFTEEWFTSVRIAPWFPFNFTLVMPFLCHAKQGKKSDNQL